MIDVDDISGGTALITNEGAMLSDSSLQLIVQKARDYPEWQKPVALRKALPPALAKELAGFVEESVRDLLLQRDDFDEELCEEISEVFRRRLDFAMDNHDEVEPVEIRLKRALESDDGISEQKLKDALGMRDYDFVIAALAYLVKRDSGTVDKILNMQAPKAIIALSYAAGLSMRFALKLQQTIGKIQPNDIIYPRDGEDYPMDQDALEWQVEFLELKAVTRKTS